MTKRVLNALNKPVPPFLNDVFNGRTRILKTVNMVDAVIRDILTIADEPFMAFVDIEELTRRATGIKNTLLWQSPFLACNCRIGGRRASCTLCKGRGWITADIYDRQYRATLGNDNGTGGTVNASSGRKGVLGSNHKNGHGRICHSGCGASSAMAGNGKEGVDHNGNGEPQGRAVDNEERQTIASHSNGECGEVPDETAT